MDSGYILIHRKIREWQWYKIPNMYYFFTELLFMANYEEKKWKNITIPRGSFITSLKHLSDRTGLTIDQVRTALARLSSSGEITRQSTHHFTIITIVKYDSYQLLPNYNPKQNPISIPHQSQQHNKVIKETNTTISFECEFFKVTNDDVEELCRCYKTTPEILNTEFIKMKRWLIRNPSKRKKEYGRFIDNWIARHFRDNGANKTGGKDDITKKEELNAYMERTFARTKST